MKRYLYLFPLMAFTAAALTLGACDDKKDADQQQAATEQMIDATETATPVPAETATAPVPVEEKITVLGAGSMATAPGATTGAIFMIINNKQAEADKLIAAKTDIVGTTAEIHESTMDSATSAMQMRKVDFVEIPANGSVTLKPDGHHIMILGLTTPLVQGSGFNATLTFEKGGDVTVPVRIDGMAQTPAMDHGAMTPPTAPAQPDADGTVVISPPVQTPPAATPTTGGEVPPAAAPVPTLPVPQTPPAAPTTAPSDGTAAE